MGAEVTPKPPGLGCVKTARPQEAADLAVARGRRRGKFGEYFWTHSDPFLPGRIPRRVWKNLRAKLGPKGRNCQRNPRIPPPNREFAPAYETCLTSQVSEGRKREIKALASDNWDKRVIQGIKAKKSPVSTSIHNDWKKPSYNGLPWTAPSTLPSSRPKRPSISKPHSPPPKKIKNKPKKFPFLKSILSPFPFLPSYPTCLPLLQQ